jgi:hypothetical protein
VLRGGPASHVRSDFSDHLQGGARADAVDLRQVHATGQVMEHRPHVEGGLNALSCGARWW